jgi:hypothetical protein
MKRGTWLIIGLLVAVAAVTAAWTPSSTADPKGWTVTVTDTDVDAAWERVGAGADYAVLQADTTIKVGYSYASRYDSLATGNFAGVVGSAWALGSTVDSGGRLNFLTRADSMSFIAAVFGNGYSTRTTVGYLYRNNDSDFRLGTANFTVGFWARSVTTTNPSAIQTVWSSASTPDYLKIRFLTSGKLNVVYTDGGTVSVLCPTGDDSLSTPTDVYDTAWHHYAVQRASTALTLYQDGAAVATTTIVNVGSVDPDTVTIGAARGGTLRFTGRLDEAFYVKAAIDTMLLKYLYRSGTRSADTASVTIIGVGIDSSLKNESVPLPLTNSATTTGRYRIYELATTDTADVWPIIVWSDASSPRKAILDSIPGGMLHGGTALKGVPKRQSLFVDEWACGPADSVSQGTLELRVYPRSIRARTPSNYYVAARARLDGGTDPAGVIQFPALAVPENGQVEVWAIGDYANMAFWTRLRGRRD